MSDRLAAGEGEGDRGCVSGAEEGTRAAMGPLQACGTTGPQEGTQGRSPSVHGGTQRPSGGRVDEPRPHGLEGTGIAKFKMDNLNLSSLKPESNNHVR